MEEKTVLTIDFGTQSVRVAIVNNAGKFLAFEKQPYEKPYFSPKPGYCEQYPQKYYEYMCMASKRLSEKNADLLKKVQSFSITSFRDSATFLDENFAVVRPSIIWLDQRQAKLKEKLPKFDSFLFWVIGMRNTIILNRKRCPAHWIKENEPENWQKIRHYVPMSSYFNYRLTGVLGDSASNMVGHFPINFAKGKWYKSEKALKAVIYGIPTSYLPEIFPTGTVSGKITNMAHMETGLPLDLKMICTGNDKSCEALGSGAINENIAHISYGTASSVAVTSKKYIESEKFLPSYVCAYPGWYSSEVQVYRGYWMLSWFLKEFGTEESAEATIEKISPEEVINKKLSEIPPGSNGLIVQPYWGPGLRRPLGKGSVIGFYDVHTKYHIYRAIIEGIAYELKEGLNLIKKKTHKKIQYITISGGGSRCDAICQITADIFNIKVVKPYTYETSSLGCAIAQFYALKEFKNLDEAKRQMVKYTKVFTPNAEAAKKYEYLFKNVYTHIYPELETSYKNLTKYLQENNEGSVE
jgi:sugar (pentulose or hexulose) kinase